MSKEEDHLQDTTCNNTDTTNNTTVDEGAKRNSTIPTVEMIALQNWTEEWKTIPSSVTNSEGEVNKDGNT